ncbi:MAG: tRNA guanosine(34) transglycosylase Tgt [Candidatus Beckwithbacteria bacterium]
MNKRFKYSKGELNCPVFFPDATRAVIKSLDSVDIAKTKTEGILVNTFHLLTDMGKKIKNVKQFMNWSGAVISDSGGFQVMSLAKTQGGKVSDLGVKFNLSKKKSILLTPEKSIEFQMRLNPDMLVVLDDFTLAKASYKEAKETVDRTVLWAKRSKIEFEKICKRKKISKASRPYLLAVVQGGDYLDLRKVCAEKLIEIGFDGYGYGGWPLTDENKFNYAVAETIAKIIPKQFFLYGLGIGKPDEVVNLVKLGYDIFDCVLPTRDARHGRLYIYTAKDIKSIDLTQPEFYQYFSPDKDRNYADVRPVSTACDCLLCTNYSRAYLRHLFKINDSTAMRLATIHNLRFYSILMEKLKGKVF